LKRILPANHSFQSGERLIFFQICLFTLVEGTHVSLERKPFVLAAGASTTFYPVRIELFFGRNTSCKLVVTR
jgi:hypothetical protein